jgi:hypothetical protein
VGDREIDEKEIGDKALHIKKRPLLINSNGLLIKWGNRF